MEKRNFIKTMNEETLETMIATLNSLHKLFDRLGIPNSERQSHIDFFAKEVGLEMGRMKSIEIQKKINSLVIKPIQFHEIPNRTQSKFS